MDWFRVYSELRTDPKLRRVARVTGESKLTVVGAWVTLLCLANDSPERGQLLISAGMPFLAEELIAELDLDSERGQRLLDAFLDVNMLTLAEDGTYIITNWSKRQFNSDNSTGRVRRHRAKKQAESGPVWTSMLAPESEAPPETVAPDSEPVPESEAPVTAPLAPLPAPVSRKSSTFGCLPSTNWTKRG